MALVQSQLSLIDTLTQVISTILNTSAPAHSTLKLAKGPFAPTPTSDPSTFTEADYTGYANQTIPGFSAAHIQPTGEAETVSTGVLTFSPTGTTVPNIITGYWIMGANGDYLGGEAFASPIPLGNPLQSLTIVPIWRVAPSVFSADVIP